jgi:hypothetical protein
MSSPPSSRPSAHGRVEWPIGVFADASLQALVPFCRQLRIQGLCPSTRSILARLTAIPDAPLWRWSRPLTPGSPFALDPPAAPRPPRQATTPAPPLLRALTRAPSGAARARRAIPTMAAGPGGSGYMLESGSGLVLGISVRSFSKARSASVGSAARPCRRWRQRSCARSLMPRVRQVAR